MTNFDSLRSSRSSYGDQRYPSAFSNGTSSGVPPKGMADGYRSVSVYSIDAHSQSQYSRVRLFSSFEQWLSEASLN